ncbi:MAG TPA: hypothetical protein VFB63_33775 [Bryobacteraceae bacterium]|jgi:hypothetical protein|nr:hypothetical protein [Bryobacteraceae bacterium]
MKDAGKYDLVVKDLFQRDHPSLLDQLTAGVPVREVLNVELARVEERRADLVLLLADGTILHLEFQSTNDRNMPYREGIYCLLLGQKYRRRVRQVVLYLGQAKMRMENQVDLGETRAAYTLMDIRQLDSEQLLASGKPGDLALAMLADGGPERISEILRRVGALGAADRRRVLLQVALLSGLRRLTGRLRMEMKTMGARTDPFYKNEFVVDIMRHAQANMLRSQLATKFGTVPKWAEDRLEAATSAQVERWAKKVLTADTLEGVIGKK